MTIKIDNLIDDEKCYETVRHLRWPDGVICPHCESDNMIRRGKDDTQCHRQRYECKPCHKRFDDLTMTILQGTINLSRAAFWFSI